MNMRRRRKKYGSSKAISKRTISRRTKNKRKNTKNRIIRSSIYIIAVLCIIYVSMSLYYINRFLPQTRIMIGSYNVDISNRGEGKARELMEAATAKDIFLITENGEERISFLLKDVGISADIAKIDLELILEEQRNWLWPFMKGDVGLTKAEVKVNENELQLGVDRIKSEIEKLNADRIFPTDAFIDKTAEAFLIVPEISTDYLMAEEIVNNMKTILLNGEHELKLEQFYQEPRVFAENEKLQADMNLMNTIVGLKVNYKIAGNTINVNSKMLKEWLEYDREIHEITFKISSIYDFLNEINNEYSPLKKGTKFSSTLRGEVELMAGSLAWSINAEAESNSLQTLLLMGEDIIDRVPRSRASQGINPGMGNIIGNTYVEVDLRNQYMWYYKDGDLILESAIVTGKPSTPTTPGVQYIWNKEEDSMLEGEDYETEVKYWMPFNWVGEGLHDAAWQPEFGGDRYLTHGSHGCVNLPTSIARALFEQTEIGTPVLVY
jgi:Uncharacterized protein conserved in bacteria